MRLFAPAFLAAAAVLPAAERTAFVNGHILTVDPQFRIRSSLVIEGERIIATDDPKAVDSAAKVIDLAGATVLPGLIDSHVHATGASTYEFDHQIPEMETIESVLAYIRQRAKVVPEGEWINLNQVFITRLREQRFPTRQELDTAAPQHPVAFRTGPDAALNSLALQLSGIDRNFQITDGLPGKIERDASGEPTGIIRAGGRLIKSRSGAKSPDFATQVDRLAELLADYNKAGITSIADRNASDGGVALYKALRDRSRLTCRVYLYYGVNAQSPEDEALAAIAKAADHPLHAYDPWLWLRGIKIFLDGGMLTGSAYMNKPWGVSPAYGIDDPAYRGMRYIEPDKLYRLAKAALSRELQFTAHSVGDGAVETLVDTYARIAENDFPVREARPCVTHCNFMSARAIDLMATHGIVADLQPVWLFLDGKTLLKQFGEDRLTWFQPYHTLFAKGVKVGGGSDHMQKIGGMRSVNPYNPFLGIWTTLTRVPRWQAGALHPEQVISREQAIILYTINNAWLSFEEKEKGSLEAGKLADFIVIDRDILTCPVDAIREIQVKETWVGGRKVHPR
ncbi:MAG: amidohydrolase [Verrucomicrobia bacterium]|nr:amidohydrolase [Verrucomicrobiota bacterium]